MEQKRMIFTVGTILISLVIIALSILGLVSKTGSNITSVGGDTDKHGCLISAGYSWNNSLGTCLREWEVDSSQRPGVRILVDYVDEDITIVDVIAYKCPGCFDIDYQINSDRQEYTATIRNSNIVAITPKGTIQSNITNFKECAAAGFAVMESYPRKCTDGNTTFIEQIMCAQDAKQCPDGSYVSRVPPTCDFAICPGDSVKPTN